MKITAEGLPGVLGNKGTWPFTFREQGNKRKIKLGTGEQKHILGNREQGTHYSQKVGQGAPGVVVWPCFMGWCFI